VAAFCSVLACKYYKPQGVRVATILEEKIQGLSSNFSRPILAMFYEVILIMKILESI